jgi:hypothetical protein
MVSAQIANECLLRPLAVFDHQPGNFFFLASNDGIQDGLVFGPGVRAALFGDGCEVPMNLLDNAFKDFDKQRVC